MPKALLLSTYDLGEWSSEGTTASSPGGSMPYGIQHLRRHFTLAWSDAQHRGLWKSRLSRKAGGAVRRAAPGLQGSSAALHAIPQLSTADVVLSIFENAGLGFARLQRFPAGSSIAHVMLACWLAEDCQHFSSFQLRSVRRSMSSISKLLVFSSNQIPLLHEFLHVETERISVVPFGVDTNYYDPSIVSRSAGGGGVVAIGGDLRRDYGTLLDAIRIANIPLTLVCYPRNLAGLHLPPNIKLLSGIPHDEYRRLLLSADLVVTPTVAPAYPSGQSVVLEAMAMGRATLTTDSTAMREYVTDGVDGVLVPAHNPRIMAQLISGLLSDPLRRQSLGIAAAKTVRERFDLQHLWSGVAEVMNSVSE